MEGTTGLSSVCTEKLLMFYHVFNPASLNYANISQFKSGFFTSSNKNTSFSFSKILMCKFGDVPPSYLLLGLGNELQIRLNIPITDSAVFT